MKLCADCIHAIKDDKPIWWLCALTRTVSPVDGSESRTTCSVARVTPALCGPEGSRFEPIPDAVDQEPPDQYNRPRDAESQL